MVQVPVTSKSSLWNLCDGLYSSSFKVNEDDDNEHEHFDNDNRKDNKIDNDYDDDNDDGDE